jgi:hypothetical protein
LLVTAKRVACSCEGPWSLASLVSGRIICEPSRDGFDCNAPCHGDAREMSIVPGDFERETDCDGGDERIGHYRLKSLSPFCSARTAEYMAAR